MERLTSKYWRNLDPWEMCGQDNYCKRGCHDQGGCTKGCIVPRIYARLAAYEDTGLEPEDLNRAFNETAIIKLAAQALSTTPDHLHDILQAEQDGRLVVLPCKAGSLIYVGRRPAIITRFFGYVLERYFHAVFCDENKGIDIPFEELGKTVFLTREEAEAALKGGDSPENRTDRR